MARKLTLQGFKQLLSKIDWPLLTFLILFLNVKLVVKIIAVVLIYILRPNIRFHFSWKNSRLPLFYLIVIGIAIINGLINHSFSSGTNSLTIFAGIFFWILCILAIHQVTLGIERSDVTVLHRTVLVFFAINILISLVNISLIILETGDINPYRYQGLYQKYFMGTGDFIRGVSFDTSTTNAVINAFAVVYFMKREKLAWMVASMATLLLTASNFTNLILFGTLATLFVFKSSRNQKSLILVCAGMMVVFLSRISPQNDQYIITGLNNYLHTRSHTIQLEASLLPTDLANSTSVSEEQKMQKTAQAYLDSMTMVEAKDRSTYEADSARTKPAIPAPSIHSASYQRRHDTSRLQYSLIAFAAINKIPLLSIENPETHKLQLGKLSGARQTIRFLRNHPSRLINGNGIGNFSSKLAFRSTALNIAGGYPTTLRYINEDFKKNHLALFLSYFTRDKENHSIINTPNSTYDQLLSEYGLLGIAAFIIYYIGFFIGRYKQLTYGIPLLIILGGMLFVEYWFEQLSIVVIFELLLLLDLKEHTKTITVINE